MTELIGRLRLWLFCLYFWGVVYGGLHHMCIVNLLSRRLVSSVRHLLSSFALIEWLFLLLVIRTDYWNLFHTYSVRNGSIRIYYNIFISYVHFPVEGIQLFLCVNPLMISMVYWWGRGITFVMESLFIWFFEDGICYGYPLSNDETQLFIEFIIFELILMIIAMFICDLWDWKRIVSVVLCNCESGENIDCDN
eukprot:130960_1